MTTMGLDLSLTNTAIAVVRNGKHKTWTHKTTPRQGSDEKRIASIWEKINKVIEKYQPNLIVIEGYAFHPKGHKEVRVGELAGVVKGHLYMMRTPPYEIVSPTALKKWATQNGRASKADMLRMAQKIHPKCKNHHEADALFLGLYAQDIIQKGKQ